MHAALQWLERTSGIFNYAALDTACQYQRLRTGYVCFRNKPASHACMSHLILKPLHPGVNNLPKQRSYHVNDLLHVHFHFTFSRVGSTPASQILHVFLFLLLLFLLPLVWRKNTTVHSFSQMWSCSDFNKQATNWGFPSTRSAITYLVVEADTYSTPNHRNAVFAF